MSEKEVDVAVLRATIAKVESESVFEVGPQHAGDDAFTKRMRLHQSRYRAEVLRVGFGRGPNEASSSRYGNMLTPEDGRRGLNFLSPEIFAIARARLAERSGVVQEYRLLHNLLSSQPMCFNLFGPLVAHLELATRLWRSILGDGEVAQVTRVLIEYAPSPAQDYLADGTAFDAFVEYRRPDGALCFTGVETKLTEPFSETKYPKEERRYARWLERRDHPWRSDALGRVDAVEHNQLWRDHLLAFALSVRSGTGYAHGRLMLVRHDEDDRCERVVTGYRALLRSDDDTFVDIPLSKLLTSWERPLSVGSDAGSRQWIAAFRRRYLDLGPPAPSPTNARQDLRSTTAPAIRDGHWRALGLVESREYLPTWSLYRDVLEGSGVYFRPTEKGLTVICTDPILCPKMVGVGGRDTGDEYLSDLPPPRGHVERAVAGFRAKLATVHDQKPEEQFSLRLLDKALRSGLALRDQLHFICQEWRLSTTDRGDKLDILAVDVAARQLVVVELKRSAEATHASDKNGRVAIEQARYHAAALYEHRLEYYPFFERLARALAKRHGGPLAMQELVLGRDLRPRAVVWVP